MARLRSYDRAPINFAREPERDFTGVEGGFDFGVGKELSGRMARREGNLHFLPDGVEAIAGDSINHRNKRLASGQTGVRLVDKIEGFVVQKEGLFSGGREFHELDFEELAVVVGGNCAGRTVRASSSGAYHDGQCQTCPDDQFQNMVFHSFWFRFIG